MSKETEAQEQAARDLAEETGQSRAVVGQERQEPQLARPWNAANSFLDGEPVPTLQMPMGKSNLDRIMGLPVKLNQNPPAIVMPEPRLRIGGAWKQGAGNRVSVDLPIPGDGTAWFRSASPDDVIAAARAAANEARIWADLAPEVRADHLRRLAKCVRAASDDLSAVQTTEAATPISQSRLSIAHSADYLDGLASLSPLLTAQKLSDRATLQHVPLGPIAVVTSWNQGFANVVQAVGNALLAGCSVIVKPSERAPFTAFRFTELALEAGLPDGIVNLVLGGPATAQALARCPDVAGLHLTGGAVAASALRTIAAERGLDTNTELGGKSALIVRADADLVAAAGHAVSGAILLSGQACANPTRLLVEASIRPKFERLLRGFLRRIVLGDPRDPQTEMGPLISADARSRIVKAVHAALDSGAGLLDPAMLPDRADCGPWLRPIVLTDPPKNCKAAQEELFGPVLCLWSFTNDHEAAAAANESPFGLTAYVHGTDPLATRSLADSLRAGTVWINRVPPLPPDIPFGGFGKSGNGRLGGAEGLHRFTRSRTVWCEQ
jgi:aldehyde dehydrogenase (NAD+)